jgi:hypothetical protein
MLVFGDIAAAARRSACEAMDLLGGASPRRVVPAQRAWWRRWAPLVTLLPWISRWNATAM